MSVTYYRGRRRHSETSSPSLRAGLEDIADGNSNSAPRVIGVDAAQAEQLAGEFAEENARQARIDAFQKGTDEYAFLMVEAELDSYLAFKDGIMALRQKLNGAATAVQTPPAFCVGCIDNIVDDIVEPGERPKAVSRAKQRGYSSEKHISSRKRHFRGSTPRNPPSSQFAELTPSQYESKLTAAAAEAYRRVSQAIAKRSPTEKLHNYLAEVRRTRPDVLSDKWLGLCLARDIRRIASEPPQDGSTIYLGCEAFAGIAGMVEREAVKDLIKVVESLVPAVHKGYLLMDLLSERVNPPQAEGNGHTADTLGEIVAATKPYLPVYRPHCIDGNGHSHYGMGVNIRDANRTPARVVPVPVPQRIPVPI